MKNARMFSFVRMSENSMVASVRIARWLSEFLDVPVTHELERQSKPVDTLIIVNGAYGFSKYLAALGDAIQSARRVVWVQNDYSIIPPRDEGDAESPFRHAFIQRKLDGKMPTIFWSTCEKWARLSGCHYVNWNMLTFDEKYDSATIARRRRNKNESLFYYGSYRDGSGKSSRVPLFRRYFQEPAVRTVISSPVDKFRNAFPKCVHVGSVTENFYQTLGEYGLGLYIEDRKSSEEFHSPANRFYEMLSAGLPMVFQPECGTMLRRAGHDPSPYIVENARAIKKMMERREQIGEQQRERWIGARPKFRERLIDAVEAARRALP